MNISHLISQYQKLIVEENYYNKKFENKVNLNKLIEDSINENKNINNNKIYSMYNSMFDKSKYNPNLIDYSILKIQSNNNNGINNINNNEINNNNDDSLDEINFIKNTTKIKNKLFHNKNLINNNNSPLIKDPLTTQKLTKYYFYPYNDEIFKINKSKNNKKFKVHDFKTDLYKKYLIPLCKIEKEKKIEDEKKNINKLENIQFKNLFYVIHNFPKIRIKKQNEIIKFGMQKNFSNFSNIKKKNEYLKDKKIVSNNKLFYKNHLNFNENENKFKLINRNNIDIKNLYIIKKENPPKERQNKRPLSNQKKRKIIQFDNNNNNKSYSNRPFTSYQNYLLKFGINENNNNNNNNNLNNVILLGHPKII